MLSAFAGAWHVHFNCDVPVQIAYLPVLPLHHRRGQGGGAGGLGSLTQLKYHQYIKKL